MPTVQGTDTFNHTISAAFYDAFFGTPTQVATPLYQSNTNALEINSPGNEGVRKNVTGTPRFGWAGVAIYIPSGASPTDFTTVSIATQSTATSCRVNVVDAGANKEIYVSLNGTNSTHAVISEDAYHWVEVILDANDGAGNQTAYWQFDGVDQSSVTIVKAASTIAYNQVLSFSGQGTQTWYCGEWQWGSAASSSDFLGTTTTVTGAASFTTTAGITTSGFKTTTGASSSTFTVGETTTGHLNWAGSAAQTFTTGITTSGARTRLGASSLTETVGVATAGGRATSGSLSQTFTVGIATTPGSRTISGSASLSVTSGVTTAGAVTHFERGAVPQSFAVGIAVSAGQTFFASTSLGVGIGISARGVRGKNITFTPTNNGALTLTPKEPALIP